MKMMALVSFLLEIFFVLSFFPIFCLNSKLRNYISYGIGCNEYYRLGFIHPHHPGKECEKINIVNEFRKISTNKNQTISDICTTYDHVLFIEDGDLYGHGYISHYSYIIPGSNPIPPVPSLVLTNVYSTYGKDLQLICAAYVLFIIHSNNSIIGMGRNSDGELGVGDLSPRNVPTTIFNEHYLFHSRDEGTLVVKEDTKTILFAGFNQGGRCGHCSINGSMKNENVLIKELTQFYFGVWALFVDGKTVYFWGNAGLSIYDPPDVKDEIYIDVPKKIDFFNSMYSDIPKDGIIIQIQCKNPCYALVKISNKRNEVYSWGESNSYSYLLGRKNSSNNYRPMLVEKGELLHNEYVKEVYCSHHSTYFLTNIGQVYSLGWNYGGLLDYVPLGNTSIKMIRIIGFDQVLKSGIWKIQRRSYIATVLSKQFGIAFKWDIFVFISISLLIFCCLVVIFVIILILITTFFVFKMKKSKNSNEIIGIDGKELKEKVLSDMLDEKSEEIGRLKLQWLKKNDKWKELLKVWVENESEVFKSRMKLVAFEDLNLIKFLGSGGSGSSIFEASVNFEGIKSIVAFKSFPVYQEKLEYLINGIDSKYGEFKRELMIYMRTNHPFVLKTYGIVVNSNNLGLVLEFCKNGDLRNYLKKNPNMRIEEKLRILFKICSGMAHLHFNDIIHRDLKLENVLLDNKLNPKIMDFGLSKMITNTVSRTKNIGTVQYQSPEMVFSGKYDEKVDVFSFAILMYIVLSMNFDPFESKKVEECCNKNCF